MTEVKLVMDSWKYCSIRYVLGIGIEMTHSTTDNASGLLCGMYFRYCNDNASWNAMYCIQQVFTSTPLIIQPTDHEFYIYNEALDQVYERLKTIWLNRHCLHTVKRTIYWVPYVIYH